MATDITTTDTAATASLTPRGKRPLDLALEDRTTTVEVETESGKFVSSVVPAPWMPPTAVTEEMRREAFARRHGLTERLVAAPEDEVYRFVLSLGTLCVQTDQVKGDGAAEIVARQYARLLDNVPRACLGKASLRRAADRFKFFPAYSELAAFLAEEHGRVKETVSRLTAIALPSASNELAASMSGKLQPAIIERWFNPLSLTVTGSTAVVRCPSAFHRDWVRSHYRDAIREAQPGRKVHILGPNEPVPAPPPSNEDREAFLAKMRAKCPDAFAQVQRAMVPDSRQSHGGEL